MIYAGIDPGVSGGVVIMNGYETSCYSCPKTVKDMADVLYPLKGRNDVRVGIESVHSMPGQGVASTFKFGKNFGEWLGILASFRVPYELITPVKWMKFYGSYPKEKNLRKVHFKNLAQQRVPAIIITLKTSDAVLIANYIKEKYSTSENDLGQPRE